jgi:hypothetical protein
MGDDRYGYADRSVRAFASGYYDKAPDEIFLQNKEKRIHESMDPKSALLRESRDSQSNPNSVPIIVALDVTGSMRSIPHILVKDGLPNMVANMIQRGINDPAILFLAIGDHENDDAPLQVGQFESGDKELDLWLTRTWLEGKGGGNDGESYLLAWYFAAKHTITDAWEKRGQKGFLFTIGDEPCLRTLPKRVVEELMGEHVQSNFTAEGLLEMAKEKYEVFHLHMMQGSDGRSSLHYWQNLLGQRCIVVEDYEQVGNIIADTVATFTENRVSYEPTKSVIVEDEKSTTEESPKKHHK